MKVLKEREIEKILRAHDIDGMKKALKIKNGNYFSSIIYKLERLVYNYNNRYDEVIYKLLEVILRDVLTTDNYLERCNKISEFRQKSSNIVEVLEKKLRRGNSVYNEFNSFIEYIDYINKQFDDSIKKSKINNDFIQVIKYLENVLRSNDLNNFDIIDKLLNYLDNTVVSEQDIVIDRCSKLNELKNIVKYGQNKINSKERHLFDYIYHKLDRIEIDVASNLKSKEEISSNKFDYLLSYLTKLMVDFNENHASSVYKVLEALENELIKGEQLDFLEESEKILKIRQAIVQRIKSTKKLERKSHQKYFYLKDIANRLENIEINMAYKIKSSEVVNNYNIVKYILFDLENISCTEKLLNQNPYIINAFNLKSMNILYLVVDKYLEAISNKGEDFYKKLCYYDKTLEAILTNKFIRIDNEVINNCMKKATSFYKSILKEGKSNEQISSWYRNLVSKLKDVESVPTKDELDKMYGVKKALYSEPDKNYSNNKNIENDDFIVTIDESSLVNKDDALGIRKLDSGLFELKTYIADPNSLFSMNSAPIRGARESAETIYYEDSKEEMFHPDIVNNYLSLDEGKLRNVRIYRFLIDKYGELVDFDISKSNVQVAKNYSYDEFNDLLNICHSSKEEEFIENLNILKNILNGKGVDADLIKSGDEISSAQKLVMIFMIYTNHKVAEYCSKNNLPFVYRHYNDDTTGVDKSILDSISWEKRKIYSRYLDEIGKISNNAFYSTESKNHDALGLGYYAHLTSPNRRYADILANQCIDNFYFNDLDDKNKERFENYLKRETARLNDKLRGIENYYEEYSRYVLTRK